MKPKKFMVLYPEPGRLNKKMICYYTTKLEKIGNPERGIKIIYSTKKQIIELIKKKKFNSASHISAFYHYLLNKN